MDSRFRGNDRRGIEIGKRKPGKGKTGLPVIPAEAEWVSGK